MRILYFEGVGNPFSSEVVGDLRNYRIRTAFSNLDGIAYYVELSATPRYKKNSYKEIKDQARALSVPHLYKIGDVVEGLKQCHEVERNFDKIYKLDYTKASITEWINEVVNCQFDSVEVLDEFYGYDVYRERDKYDLIDNFDVNHELASRRREAYRKIDDMYKKALNERFTVITLREMDENSITIRCHASEEALRRSGLPRFTTIAV
ncbi:hypothetical protein [Thermoactinomyces sp. DSM 45892]|uniref:hypothetical protein n=1 Tax=Thermoactinomyces sp. DSM 45892 TaxID=1882753 RepID=UPI0008961ADB|nr:hypothetical protein [Thermoactinomyces sp. DSM 45892]SDX94407.1 hypothetical protein SAMN05444416_10169 [Thermoactinomyces sp. DSM 45892]